MESDANVDEDRHSVSQQESFQDRNQVVQQKLNTNAPVICAAGSSAITMKELKDPPNSAHGFVPTVNLM